MKDFSSAWIARLNAQSDGGVFFLAVALTVGPGDIRYYADTQRTITFDGHAYQPLPMTISGMGQTNQQSLPARALTVSNVSGTVGQFLETTSLLGHDLRVLLLHLDLLADVTAQDSERLQIAAYHWGAEQAVFSLTISLGLDEVLPRHFITAAEFPGVPEGYRRGSIL